MVYDRPMIFYPIQTMKDSGITDIIISLSHHHPEWFMKLLGDGSEFGVNLSYVIHGDPKGIAYGIYHARNNLGDKFLVLLGDNFFENPFDKDAFEYGSYDAMVFTKPVEDPSKYGILDISPEGEVRGIVEKPAKPTSNYAMLGAYFLSSKCFKIFETIRPSQRGEYEITDIITNLIATTKIAPYHGVWFDLGTPQDILRCASYLSRKESKP